MPFKGQWSNRSRTAQLAPLVSDRNPEHLTPTPDPNLPPGATPNWRQSAGNVPTLPDEIVARQIEPVLTSGWGAIDQTPQDHDYGLGFQPGLDVQQNLEARAVWHSDDQGAVAAYHWVRPKDRDGSPHAAWVDHEPEPVDSMAQVEYRRMGVGAAHDPNAVRGKRLKRWYERYIDFHRYDVEMRPYDPKSARPPKARPMVPDGDQTTPNTGSAAGSRYAGPSDRFLLPMMRQQPASWVEDQVSDGAAQTMAGVPSGYGLTSWGM